MVLAVQKRRLEQDTCGGHGADKVRGGEVRDEGRKLGHQVLTVCSELCKHGIRGLTAEMPPKSTSPDFGWPRSSSLRSFEEKEKERN